MAAKEFPLAVVIRAVDRVTGPLRGATNAIQRFGTRVRATGRGISDKLGLPVLTAAAGKLGGSLWQLGRRVALIGGAIAAMGAAATASAFRMVEAFAAAGDEVAKTADRLGIGIERFQELRYAAGQNGIEADKFTMAMTKLNTNVGMAAAGTGEAAKVIEGLGLRIRDSEGKVRSVGDLLPELADKFALIEEPAVAAAAAAALFGERNGSKMLTLLRQGSKGMSELSAEARRLGLIIGEEAARGGEEFGDRMDDLKLAITGVRNIIGTSLLPRLTQLAKTLTELVVANQGRIKAFFDGFAEQLPGRIDQAVKFLGDLRAAIQPVLDGIGWLVDRFGGANVALAAIGGVLAVTLIPALYATTTAIYAMGAAILATPIGWIIAGVAALVAGLVWLYDEFEVVREVMDAIGAAAVWLFKNFNPIGILITKWDEVKARLVAVYDALRPVGRVIAWVFMNMTPIGLAIKNWDTMKTVLGYLWEGLKAVGSAVAWVFMNMTPLGLVIQNWDALKAGLGFVWEKLQAVGEMAAWAFLNFTPIGQLIQHWDKVRAAIDAVSAALSDMWEFMKSGFGLATGWVDGLARKLSGMIPDWAQGMFGGDAPAVPAMIPSGAPTGAAVGARQAGTPARNGQEGEVRVKVDFANTPPGTRVKTETEGRPKFELNQGFAMGVPG